MSRFYALLALAIAFTFANLSLTSEEAKKEESIPDSVMFKPLPPRNIGPGGMSGRITSIAVNPRDKAEIFVGAASGGVWRSRSAGIEWEPVFDEQPVLSIGALEIDPTNPNRIWAGTGEGNPRNSQSSGGGIYLSRDGGDSWELMGLENTSNIHRVVVNANNPNVIYAGAQGSAWKESENRGLYISKDGGKSWEKKLYVNETTGIADLVADPTNPDKMFAAMWDFHRDPWYFRSGGEGSGLYVTYDGGENWKKLGPENGLPKGELGRIGLAVSHSSPSRVYALVEAAQNSLYVSDDGGKNFRDIQPKGNYGNRPFYYSDIFVDPQNENRIYSIHSMVSRSEDGGKTWEVIVPYSGVHPDHHAFWIDPENPDFMIDGNDGGMAITHDRGVSWRFVENIPVAQFYHINYDMDTPYNVYGGMQDNGSWKGPSSIWKSGGIRNSYWKELMFGDGFDVLPDAENSRFGYAMWQQGNLGYYDTETGTSRYIQPVHPKGEELRFHWNAAIVADPFDPNTVYFGSQYVHKTTDKGNNWEIISPDLTRLDTLKQSLSGKTGGLTLDVTGAENYNSILAIEPSPIEQGVIWTGADDGALWVTRDGGKNWSDVSPKAGVPDSGWIPQIHASKYKKGEAFAVINDYRRGDDSPYLMKTSDYGKTWKNIVSGKGINTYVLSFVQDPVEPKLMFLGTERGLYYSLDEGSTWEKWKEGYPSASTMDMRIHPREHDLIIGTFGRAAWIFDDIRYMREWARTGRKYDSPLTILSAEDGYLGKWGTAEGVRFAADATYEGDNKGPAPTITFNLIPQAQDTTKPKDERFPADSVMVEITTPFSDAEIRKFWVKADTALSRVSWDMTRDGLTMPNQPVQEDMTRLPSGPTVLPGTYRAILHYMDYRDTVDFNVSFDPRIEASEGDLARMEKTYEGLTALISRLKKVSEVLRQKEKSLTVIDKIIEISEGETKDTLQARTKAIRDSIEKVWVLLRGEKGGKGIVRQADLLINNLQAPYYYLGSSELVPGNSVTYLIGHAEEQAAKYEDRAEKFLNEEWPAYKAFVEGLQVGIFKE